MTGAVLAPAQRLASDFYRLWGAYTVSQIGSALGAGALPMVAILVLDASNLQVSLLAAMAGVASAAIALPMGSFIDFRRKRPIMVWADLLVFAALASVPAAAWLDVLTYAQLSVVVTVQTVCAIVFNAANSAYLKSLVPQEQRIGSRRCCSPARTRSAWSSLSPPRRCCCSARVCSTRCSPRSG